MKTFFLVIMFMFPVFCFAGDSVTTMRCNNSVVSLKDSWRDVLNKCGNPTDHSNGIWTYDFGANYFTYVITFDKGLVNRIVNTGNWGKNKYDTPKVNTGEIETGISTTRTGTTRTVTTTRSWSNTK